MKLIVCLDDNNAMAFYNRRQSSDIAVVHKIAEFTQGQNLWMNSYSGYLFADFKENIRIADDFLTQAKEEDFCFAEISDVHSYIPKVREVYIFRWNRVYPGDLYFPKIPAKKQVLAEFSGKSHERITLEVYHL